MLNKQSYCFIVNESLLNAFAFPLYLLNISIGIASNNLCNALSLWSSPLDDATSATSVNTSPSGSVSSSSICSLDHVIISSSEKQLPANVRDSSNYLAEHATYIP